MAHLNWQGQGVAEFSAEPAVNLWLTKHDFQKSSRVINAIKLRTNTYPTRAVMSMIRKEGPAECRHCGDGIETLGHILGKCVHTKSSRIKRHNEIKDLIKARLAKDNPVMDEPELWADGERLKPDLVVKTNELGVLVLDVTVRYEHRDYLAKGAEKKIRKYTKLIEPLKRSWGVTKGEVVPIVVGSQGAIPADTKAALRKFGISSKKDILTISMIALRSSIEIANTFINDFARR